MEKRFNWRLSGVFICLLLAALSLYRPPAAQEGCLGVSVMDEQTYAALAPADDLSFADSLMYNGQRAAVDHASGTAYLSVALAQDAAELTGSLYLKDSPFSLYFAPDPMLRDLPAAIAGGHAFELIALRGSENARLSVVFTPLIVISMTADDPLKDHTDPELTHDGALSIWEPGEKAQSTHANWHRRGRSTLLYRKGSWRITLKTALGKASQLSLGNLGHDDDWVLNSMIIDDLKVRERFVSTLWNTLHADDIRAVRMSQGRYAEVILNGEYAGLYLLQRRIDEDYLGLNKTQDILLKGNSISEIASVEDAFLIESSPRSARVTYDLAAPAYTLEGLDDTLSIDLDNWIDLDLFVLFGALFDSYQFRNTFYVLRPSGNSYSMSTLLWDTDVSFGIEYIDLSGFKYLPDDEYFPALVHRREYEALKALYPDLDARIAARWQELRQGLFSRESLIAQLDALNGELVSSGARARDWNTWPLRHHGKESYEAMLRFIDRRLSQMDEALALQTSK